MLLLMHPSMQLSFIATRAHWWLIQIASWDPSDFFFFGAIRLSLLIFMKGLSAFGVSRYLWMAAIPVTILATECEHSVPPLRSLTKALNYTSTNLWGILFIITYSSKCWYHSLVLHAFSKKTFRTEKLTYTSKSVVPEFSNSLPAVLVLEGRTK